MALEENLVNLRTSCSDPKNDLRIREYRGFWNGAIIHEIGTEEIGIIHLCIVRNYCNIFVQFTDLPFEIALHCAGPLNIT